MTTDKQYLYSFITCLGIILCNAEDKWAWSKETKSERIESETSTPLSGNSVPTSKSISRLFDDNDYRKTRYEVEEAINNLNGPPEIHIKPNQFGVRPSTNRFPSSQYPSEQLYQGRPPLVLRPNRYPSPQPLPQVPDRYPPPVLIGHGYGPTSVPRPLLPPPLPPPPSSTGILTGPVPSWERPFLHRNGDPTNFDTCKCSFSFNCKSPGIQFGSCDHGKTYCCYNEFNKAVRSNSFGPTNIDSFGKVPALLVGPGRPSSLIAETYLPFVPSYSELNSNLNPINSEKSRPYPIISQKPVLPAYAGLHNDYRSSK